ncbi:MAG: MurR/RpiR family transcriptional regulator [Chloroflexi bacterium]|nr:MurR/RpiR family transcriptional regulator [Chloroflexota bacterium]
MPAPVLEHIARLYPELSPTHKNLADFVAEHPDQVAFLSAHRLARRTDTSASTVVRFVQVLGYSGYDNFLDELQDYLRKRITPLAKLQDTLSVYGHTPSPASQAIEEDLRALNDALNEFKPETFERAINLLNRATNTYVIGLGISYAVAYAFEFRLRRLGLRVFALGRGGSDLFDGLLALLETDVMVVIGFHRPHPELFTAIDLARQRKVSVIAITDSPHSPLARLANVVLYAKRGPVRMLNSLAVPMSIANALALGLAQKRQAVASQTYQTLSALEDDYATQVQRGRQQ